MNSAFALSLLGEADVEERCALLLSAYEDYKALVAEASPDSLRRQYDLQWHIILTFAVEGAKCNPLTPSIEVRID